MSPILKWCIFGLMTVAELSLGAHAEGECSLDGTFGPTIQETLVTSYISADNPINGSTICRMVYRVPENATVWQGMLSANQQHGENFTFVATTFSGLGHFITTINGVTAITDYWWAIFDQATTMLTPVGVDSLYLQDGASYIWQYTFNYSFNGNYTGPCLTAPDTQASMPFTYVIAYITVSSENTEPFQNGTQFKPVCKQLVLFYTNESTLYDVLSTANDQVPLQINATFDNSQISFLNTLPNQDGYAWVPFNATSNEMLSRDLQVTTLIDGDHIIFRFIQMTETATETVTETVTQTLTTGSGAPCMKYTGLMFVVSLIGVLIF